MSDVYGGTKNAESMLFPSYVHVACFYFSLLDQLLSTCVLGESNNDTKEYELEYASL
jgi:hypothetical protein